MKLKEKNIECPHCGHHLFVELDYSAGDQDFFVDCSNCCNPIHLNMHIDEMRQKLELTVDSDNEQIY